LKEEKALSIGLGRRAQGPEEVDLAERNSAGNIFFSETLSSLARVFSCASNNPDLQYLKVNVKIGIRIFLPLLVLPNCVLGGGRSFTATQYVWRVTNLNTVGAEFLVQVKHDDELNDSSKFGLSLFGAPVSPAR
jgi:hypothetical protein